jgi:hypothetical protein
MEHLITISLVSATALLGAGMVLAWMRREVAKKRNDYRMGQALRRGLANPEGMRPGGLQVVQLQSCESTSAQCS